MEAPSPPSVATSLKSQQSLGPVAPVALPNIAQLISANLNALSQQANPFDSNPFGSNPFASSITSFAPTFDWSSEPAEPQPAAAPHAPAPPQSVLLHPHPLPLPQPQPQPLLLVEPPAGGLKAYEASSAAAALRSAPSASASASADARSGPTAAADEARGTCGVCGRAVPLAALASHLSACYSRADQAVLFPERQPVQCARCGRWLAAVAHPEHSRTCSGPTATCVRCSRAVPMVELESHQRQNCRGPVSNALALIQQVSESARVLHLFSVNALQARARDLGFSASHVATVQALVASRSRVRVPLLDDPATLLHIAEHGRAPDFPQCEPLPATLVQLYSHEPPTSLPLRGQLLLPSERSDPAPHFRLRADLLRRTSIWREAAGETSGRPATPDAAAHLLAVLWDARLLALLECAAGLPPSAGPYSGCRPADERIEAAVHGPVDLRGDSEALILPARLRLDPAYHAVLSALARNVTIEWF